jgi:hypothetical protein
VRKIWPKQFRKIDSRCANEDDNPVAFLRFEHPELSKDTFVKEQKLVGSLLRIRRALETRKQLIKIYRQKVRGKNRQPRSQETGLDSITAFGVIKRSVVNIPYFKSWNRFYETGSAEIYGYCIGT